MAAKKMTEDVFQGPKVTRMRPMATLTELQEAEKDLRGRLTQLKESL
ncbi:MAG: hypothetical protein P1V35_13400 [Planctomycetota bacterium]|nr:hypothetical protein [Planctomycetota bacterium]